METFLNWRLWKYRVFYERAVKFSTRVSVKCCRAHDNQRTGSFLKQRISHGSSDGQCRLCSRNCERQRCVRRNLSPIVCFFKNLYTIAASLKMFLPVDRYSGWYGVPHFRCRPRVCVFLQHDDTHGT